ncbi:hypothetical protein ACFVSQ_04295 [Streptomyces niveus]|uniref:hypothetical protein n=1 Tax=Streptomyces niveus TaxID=193462 RepID=UPI0036EE68B7
MRPSLSRKSAVLALAVTVIAVPVLWLGHRLWNGDPYPSADPDAVAVQLGRDAQLAYDDLVLPGRPEVTSQIRTGACYYRGLRSFAHIDRSRLDVNSFELRWDVTGVSRETARAGQDRLRLRLIREGFKLTSEESGDAPMGYRFTHPDSEHMVDVNWYESTSLLAFTAYAPCGKVPAGFNEYKWPQGEWTVRP